MSVYKTDHGVFIDHGDRLIKFVASDSGTVQVDMFTDKGRQNFHLCDPEEVSAVIELLKKAVNQ